MAKNGTESASGPAVTGARRAPAGAAVLREDKTAAIRAAVFEELAAVGFARMSIEGIARRAGVGKTAVYRRWRSKLHLVLDVVSAVAMAGLPAPDTGALRGDVRMLLEVAARALRHPMASQIIPDLLAEAARSPELAAALKTALHDSQEGVAAAVVARAVERGELSTDVDSRLALDLLTGPLYWRLLVTRDELPAGYLDALAGSVTAALGAE
ncbi:TetR/AcrR family transcriptional regulator [Streptomyces sp. NPDC057743]|uniref:TetR/AcrR family transcriptional regulator n=1 Tax=Streptomyces sp. NPDC057743 TaxID=3346236 RepID=UPI00367A6B5F